MMLSQFRILHCVVILCAHIATSVGAQENPVLLNTKLSGDIIAADAKGYTAIDMKSTSGFILRKYDREGVKQKDITVNFTPPDTNLQDNFLVHVFGNYLIVQFQRNFDASPVNGRSIGVWTLDGAAVFLETVPAVCNSFANFADLQIDDGHLYWRCIGEAPIEQIDRITLSNKEYKTIAQLPTASINMRVRGGVITVLRNERNADGNLSPYLRNFDLSGRQTAQASAADFFDNGHNYPFVAPFGKIALIDEDPLKPDELPVAAEWDFLTGTMIFDRSTLKRKRLIERTGSVAPPDASTALHGERVSGVYLYKYGGYITTEVYLNDRTITAAGKSAAFDGNATIYVSGPISDPTIVKKVDVNNALSPTFALGSSKPLTFNGAFDRRPSYLGGADFSLPGAGSLSLPIRFGGLVEPISVKPSFLVGSEWVFDQAEQRIRYTGPLAVDDRLYIDTSPYFDVIDARGSWSLSFIKVRVFNSRFPPTRLVEFYNTTLDHYFMTLEGSEAEGIDRGAAGPGWRRTGYGLQVWKDAASAPPGAMPVCRFYGNPKLNAQGQRIGPNSHFYTIDPNECESVQRDPGWILETKTAFYALPPNPLAPRQRCDSFDGFYRWYNNGAGTNNSNHRYTTYEPNSYSAMEGSGWTPEGLRFCGL